MITTSLKVTCILRKVLLPLGAILAISCARGQKINFVPEVDSRVAEITKKYGCVGIGTGYSVSGDQGIAREKAGMIARLDYARKCLGETRNEFMLGVSVGRPVSIVGYVMLPDRGVVAIAANPNK